MKFGGPDDCRPRSGSAGVSRTATRAVQCPTGMLHRLRTLHISLAAKCQLLFGAAVVLIIGAALWVPWQRMEQLTGQINERTARSLCDDTIADHLAGLPPNVRAAAATTMPTLALPN